MFMLNEIFQPCKLCNMQDNPILQYNLKCNSAISVPGHRPPNVVYDLNNKKCSKDNDFVTNCMLTHKTVTNQFYT